MADKRNIIDRMNYVAGYVINETPTYRPIIDSSSFDSIPNMGEADAAPQEEPEAQAGAPEQAASPAPAAPAAPAEPSAGSPEAAASTPPAAPAAPPAPAAPSTSINPPLPDAQVNPAPPPAPEPAVSAAPAGQGTTDQLQADVLRFQLDAMKKMTQKIDQLEDMLSSLNAQNAELHKEVEKVRDPSDIEKFANRKEDSSPYYFNLNDMWNGNTFQARMDNYNSKGIVKTKDGYVADFDQLPKMNAYQLKDSFEQV